jgi:tetratricopeptide (TPR) repeat protein
MASRVLAILVTVAVCALLFRVSIAHFVVRVISDQRITLPREMLLSSAEKHSGSARINYRLAESLLIPPVDPASALDHAARAVELSPWDYQYRRMLALAQELNGRQAEAESSIYAAVRLAPHHAELNWTQANILLRSGKLDASVEHFHRAASMRPDFLIEAFELLWTASSGNLDTLNQLTKCDPEMQLSLVRFLIGQSRVDDAIAIFKGVDRQARLESPRSADFLNTLIQAGQYASARTLWLDLAGALTRTDPASAGNVWNSGFEVDRIKALGQFDWQINPNQYARIGFDRAETRGGLRSLRMLFSGIDTTTIRDQVKQLVALRPGARYRLECYAKSTDLMTPEGPRLAIFNGNSILATSEPVAEGTSDWRQLVVNFVAPTDNSPKFISIVRIPKFSYDDPTKGTIWFDDFALTELGNGK